MIMNKYKIKVVGTGSYLPPNIVTNDDLGTIFETNDEWIKTRTGISQRHIANPDQTTTELGTKSLNKALEMANLNADDLDVIIVATTTPDLIFPSTAIQIQHNIGMRHGFGFDINTVCSGFIYATYIAQKFLQSGDVKRVAVVGTEIMSRILNWEDRTTAVLFGDGAGAVIFEAYQSTNQSDSDIIDIALMSNALLKDSLYAIDKSYFNKNHTLRHIEKFIQPQVSSVHDMKFGVCMDGSAVFKHAVSGMSDMSIKLLEKNHLQSQDVDWLLLHQANMRITSSVAEKLKIDENKVMESISTCANTAVATIPITLDKYVRDKSFNLQHGDIILMATAGAGMTFSSCLLRW